MSNSCFIDSYTTESCDSPIEESILSKNPYAKTVMAYAIKCAINDLGSYWSTEDAQSIVNEETFGYIWNSYPDTRKDLLSLSLNKVINSGYSSRVTSLSEEFCKTFIENLYKEIPEDDKLDTNMLRVRIVPIVDSSFDYLSELNKHSLIELDSKVYDVWAAAAMSSSKDEQVFDYLWSKVKRERGATDKKEALVKAAQSKGCLSDSLVKKIAKSSPKRLKKAVVMGLADSTRLTSRILRNAENDHLNTTTEQICELKEKLANLESRAMLFVGCDDYSVVESLIDCLSRDNLPWLMPSASQHYWLTQRLERLIESE